MIFNELGDSDANLTLLLRNQISQADRQQQPSYLSWDALNSIMVNIGDEQFDYDSFKNSYDTNPMIQQLVQRFDARGVELKTKNKNPKKGQPGGEGEVAKMAKAATARRQNESEIQEMAGLFEALALRHVMLSEGKLDEAGVWNAVKSAVGKGASAAVSGVTSANDAANRLIALAKKPQKVADFNTRVRDGVEKIKADNPKVGATMQKYADWALKPENQWKQGVVIGAITALTSFVGTPGAGASMAVVLRTLNGVVKGEDFTDAAGQSLKVAAVGGALGAVAHWGLDNIGSALTQALPSRPVPYEVKGLVRQIYRSTLFGSGELIGPGDVINQIDKLRKLASDAIMPMQLGVEGDPAKATKYLQQAQQLIDKLPELTKKIMSANAASEAAYEQLYKQYLEKMDGTLNFNRGIGSMIDRLKDLTGAAAQGVAASGDATKAGASALGKAANAVGGAVGKAAPAAAPAPQAAAPVAPGQETDAQRRARIKAKQQAFQAQQGLKESMEYLRLSLIYNQIKH